MGIVAAPSQRDSTNQRNVKPRHEVEPAVLAFCGSHAESNFSRARAHFVSVRTNSRREPGLIGSRDGT